jgi:hypothetical protein
MGKDETADERARAIEWMREVEASAAELVELGDLLFTRGEPSDPVLLPRYQHYSRVKAALALPPGLERVAALHAAKIGDRKKH